MHRLWTALAMMLSLWVALSCGTGADERMVRQYAKCMADPNSVLHRRTVPNAVGAVPLGTEAVEARLHAQLERGEVTMERIRADYARYCE